MIVSRLIGGLGNQMFQYATGRALALKRNEEFFVDIIDFENYTLHNGYALDKPFRMRPSVANEKLIKENFGWKFSHSFRCMQPRLRLSRLTPQYIDEPHFQHWPGLSLSPTPCYISGYWQSEKYFLQFEETIRSDFAFLPFSSVMNEEISKKIFDSKSVAIHIRRGDYANDQKTSSVHGLCSIDYYQHAIAKIKEFVPKPHFFFFSDDIQWAKENLPVDDPHEFVSNNQGAESYNDMHLMSLCKHNIIANSSFSWWGAWLNSSSEKLVIAPKQWFSAPTATADLLPNDWICL